MNAPQRIRPDEAKPASLAERILAGDLSQCAEHYSDEEWRREAQAALDGDDRDLNRMVEEGRLHDAHGEWQSLGALKGIDRQFIDIESGPFAAEYFALAPVRSTKGMAHVG